MRRIIAIGTVAAFAVILGTGSLSVAWASSPATTYIPVTSADLINSPTLPGPGQFNVTNEGDGTGGVSMVNGPGSARGSLQLTVTGTGSHWSVVNDDHNSTLLTGITALSYSTYTNDASGTLDPVLQLTIDPGNTTGLDAGVTFSTLSFEPYLQTPAHSVVANSWQTWNVLNGVVWGTHLTGAPNSAPLSWSTFLADYPNARIIGGVGVGVGSNWGAMVGNVSGLTIGTSGGTTSYIFEPIAYLQITTASLPSGTVGAPYSASLVAIGGNPPYKWSVASGRLPMGLHLNKATGAISGTPAKKDSGTYDITVRVVDTKVKVKHQPPTRNSATQALSISIS